MIKANELANQQDRADDAYNGVDDIHGSINEDETDVDAGIRPIMSEKSPDESSRE